MANVMVAVFAIMSVAETDQMTVCAQTLFANSTSFDPANHPTDVQISDEGETKIQEFSADDHLSNEMNTAVDEPFIGPREAISDDFMTPENSGPHDVQHSLATGFSPKEQTIFEVARDSGSKGKRKLYAYDPVADYSCLINRMCPSGKTCITSSSGLEFVVTLTYDVPGNDLVQYNNMRNSLECADKCEAYGTACQAFLFLKEGHSWNGYWGRCWLKTMKTTDPNPPYPHRNPTYGDFYDRVSNTPSLHPNLLR